MTGMFRSKERKRKAAGAFLPASAKVPMGKEAAFVMHACVVDTDTHYIQERYGELCGKKETEISLWCWKGEKASAEIAVLSGGQPLENVKIDVGEFQCGEAVLPPASIEFSFLREVDAFIGHAGWYARNPRGIMPWGPKMKTPDVVFRGEAVNMEPHQVQPVWVELTIPADFPAGRCTGTFTLTAENAPDAIAFRVTLEVLDAVMPRPEDYAFTVEYWQHPYNVAEYYGVEPFSAEHLDILRRHMELYKSLGGRVVTASIVEEAWGGQTYSKNPVRYPSMVRWSKGGDGTFHYDYSQFDKWIALNKELGIGEHIVCYSLLPWNNIVTYFDEATGKMEKMRVKSQNAAAYEAVWLPFLRDFAAHLDEKGWFSSVYLGFDERRNMDIAFDAIDKVKNKEGKIFKKSASFNDFIHNRAIFDRLSTASVGLDEVRSHQTEFRGLAGERSALEPPKETSLYTATEHYPNSFALSMPCESYWSVFYAGKMGADGFLRWAFDAWVEDPLKDATHWSFQAGDCFLVYPDLRERDEKGSQYSVRLKKLDEAVRDFNKLRKIGEECPRLQSQIKTLLDSVKENYSSFTQYHPFWGPAIRKGTWADEAARQQIPLDMRALKDGVKAISEAYIEMQNGEKADD